MQTLTAASRPSPFVLSEPEPEGRSSGEQDGLGFGLGLLEKPEEGVVLHTDLPEDLAAVPAGHGKLQRVVMGIHLKDADISMDEDVQDRRPDVTRSVETYSSVCSQLNEEPLAFEAQLANLGPVEGVNFCVPLN